MAEQSENVEYAGAAVASPLRQRNAGGLQGVTSALKERSAARPCHSMALYNVQGVSARHRAGQEAREGDAGLTCGGA